MTIKLLAHNNGSESAKAIAEGLGILKLKKEGFKWKGKKGDVIVNWGSSAPYPLAGEATYTNVPHAVAAAVDKLKTFQAFDLSGDAIPFPPYTTDKAVAERWLDGGCDIVVRHKINGAGGEGIHIVEAGKDEELPDAPLYTMYGKKTDEFRVHIFNGEVIDVQRKSRKKDVPDENVNWKIRNLEGGFIFQREGIAVEHVVLEAALRAVKAIGGLLHGAVDVGYHAPTKQASVYEVNTACGLSGSTLETYLHHFRKYLGLEQKPFSDDYKHMQKFYKLRLEHIDNPHILVGDMVRYIGDSPAIQAAAINYDGVLRVTSKNLTMAAINNDFSVHVDELEVVERPDRDEDEDFQMWMDLLNGQADDVEEEEDVVNIDDIFPNFEDNLLEELNGDNDNAPEWVREWEGDPRVNNFLNHEDDEEDYVLDFRDLDGDLTVIMGNLKVKIEKDNFFEVMEAIRKAVE